MISPENFTKELNKFGIDFFTGVPDSLLKDFCAYIQDNFNNEQHIISANEGTAVAIASGYQMASGKIPLIYLQNSGFGNTINPLISLTDARVYSIPLLLLMGWRGEPGTKDEPQHLKQGEVTIPLLKALNIPFFTLDEDEKNIFKSIHSALKTIEEIQTPVVLLAKKGVFSKYEKSINNIDPNLDNLMTREEVISLIISSFPSNSIFISSTGYISRELYELRELNNQSHASDFLTVGSMGHSSQIALGISLAKKEVPVICLDGDGAMIMHMGGLVTCGINGPKNFFHILLNNSVHDSVGGQPTSGFKIEPTLISNGCQYKYNYGPCDNELDIKQSISNLNYYGGPAFLEIRIKPGARKNLGRPKEAPIDNKNIFIKNLNERSK